MPTIAPAENPIIRYFSAIRNFPMGDVDIAPYEPPGRFSKFRRVKQKTDAHLLPPERGNNRWPGFCWQYGRGWFRIPSWIAFAAPVLLFSCFPCNPMSA